MQIAFMSVGSTAAIIQVVSQQQSRYNYIFPTPLNVSTYFFCNLLLTSVQSGPFHVPSNRTKPYRNSHIIAVIRDLFFTGGVNSFANRYQSRFPTFQTGNGKVVREVPPVMVALVATAVSTIFFPIVILY